ITSSLYSSHALTHVPVSPTRRSSDLIMVEMDDADGMISGLTSHYSDGLRPPLQIIRTARDSHTAAGIYMVTTRHRVLFFADTTRSEEHTSELQSHLNIVCRLLLAKQT